MNYRVNTRTIRPALVVWGWALFNVALIVVLIVFHGNRAETGLYGASVALVSGYGGAVVLAAYRHRGQTVRQQCRQPVRSGSVFLLGLGCLLVAVGSVYHWWIAALAIYPLIAALRLRRGERLPAGVNPVPATITTDLAPPLPTVGDLPHPGSALGESVPLPATHPARRPPRRAVAASDSKPTHPWRLILLAVALLRSIVRSLRGRTTRAQSKKRTDD